MNRIYKLVAFSLLLTIIAWFSAPDFRFISGVFFGLIFLGVAVVFENNKFYHKLGKLILLFFSLGLIASAGKRTFNYYHEIKELKSERPFASFLYKPYGVKAQKGIKLTNVSSI